MKVTREVTFDSAHLLSNYKGKCHNLHGHTYRLQVTLEGEVGETGMVMDFKELDGYIHQVTESYDHAIIFSSVNFREEPEDELLHWAEKFGMNYIICGGKCTAENIVIDIQGAIQSLVGPYEVSCRLWETPDSFAETV